MGKTKSKQKEPAKTSEQSQSDSEITAAAGRWRNRIVAHGSKPADQFTGHPNNPRKHPQAQRDALRGSLDTLGWVAPVIESKRSGFIIDGHERIWQALAADNAEVPYIQVDLTPEEESQALLSLDFIAAMAETDMQNMDELLRSFNSDNADVQTFLAELAQESHLDFMGINAAAAEMADADNPYSRKILVPVYEPKGECPEISELIDRNKTEQLLSDIEGAGLPEGLSVFLKLAAERHTIFKFRQIAEFYCHANSQTKDLMERSGLVIIDFNKAIEYGFVHLTERLGALADQEEGDA